MNAAIPPYLTLDDRVAYLTRKNYLFGSAPSEDDMARMGRVNFHYLLGYARNYRMLASRNIVPTDDVLHRVLAIIDADHALSVVVFRALRTLEWRLRALLVEHHCAVFPASGCYLDPDHYVIFDPELPPLHELLTKHIARSKEPFVTEHLAGSAPACDLPIWAVVDTWTFGALSRVICETGPATTADGEVLLWKRVAGSLGVSAGLVMDKLRAVLVLRNLIAHHSRLWMRPTTNTPKVPNVFPAPLRRSIHSKSQYVVLLTLAEMLGPTGVAAGRTFLNEVDAILGADAAYRHGITQVGAKTPPA